MNDSLSAELLLSLVPGVGPRTRKSLLERFGTAQGVFEAAPSELREVDGVGPKLCQKIALASREFDVAAELEVCRQNNIALLVDSQPDYPQLLRQIPDPPGILFVQGTIQPCDSLAVAIVGTRHATHYGKQQAERLAGGLARAGLTIVSGLARGIDVAAHRGALEAGGRTLAVLGSGLLEIYPSEHTSLAVEVAKHGAVVSELPPRRGPFAGAFPQRNRIITGLSLGVIVVEASDRSGALISARHAMEQNREVFAVPGRIDSRNSRGCHRLLRDGAKLVESIDDVLVELGHLPLPAADRAGETVHHPAELALNDVERQVLAAIQPDPTPIDSVVVASGLAVANVLATLSALEIRRLIRRVSGNLVLRV
jgi:DNA processing protein